MSDELTGGHCLKVSSLYKSFGKKKVVQGVDFEMTTGEVLGLLGPNGAGKTTSFYMIVGFYKPTSGEIFLDNQRITDLPMYKRAQIGISYLPQEPSVFRKLTVEENICICNLPRKGGFTDRKTVKDRAAKILERMKLSHLMGELVMNLAPDQQYMVELAKAIVQEPKILMIDEITSALYREEVDIVDEIIKDLKRQGCSILFISHRMSELYAMCDSVTIMKNGETLGTYAITDKTEDEFLSLMVGSKIESYHGEGRHQRQTDRDVLVKADRIPIPSYGTVEKLEIGRGEIIGVAGLQGHGQTELLKALYGAFGKISLTIDGKQTEIKSAREAVRQGFAYISGDRERDGTFSERSLEDNLIAVKELVKSVKAGNAKEILDGFHVRYDNVRQQITALSGGNQQKIVVARWLITSPKLILADDPTKGIDVKARADLHEELAKIVNDGNAVLMVSSDDDELVSITSRVPCSRVIVMKKGEIAYSGSVSEVYSHSKELKEMGLNVPQVTEIFLKLKEKGVDCSTDIYTVEQGVEQLKKLLGETSYD